MHFLLKPSSGSKGRSTIAALTVLVDGVAVWPVADVPDISMEIPIDDLLSHLVEFWEPLALRQTYPLPVAPMRPMELRMEAERRWDEQPAETAEREDLSSVLSKRRMIFRVALRVISTFRHSGCCAGASV